MPFPSRRIPDTHVHDQFPDFRIALAQTFAAAFDWILAGLRVAALAFLAREAYVVRTSVKAATLIFKNGEGIYNFQGLRAFKK